MLTPLSPFDIKCKKLSKKKKGRGGEGGGGGGGGGGGMPRDSLCSWQKLGNGWQWLGWKLLLTVVT